MTIERSTHVPFNGRRSRHARLFASSPKLVDYPRLWSQSAASLDRSDGSVRDRVRDTGGAGRNSGLRCRWRWRLQVARPSLRGAVPGTPLRDRDGRRNGPRPHQPRSTGVTVLAMWLVAADGARGGEIEVAHTGWMRRDRAVNAGDHIDVWVDDAGAPVAPPTPPSQAGLDAVGYGAGIWLVAALGLTAAVGMVRSPLNRIRRVQWERRYQRIH